MPEADQLLHLHFWRQLVPDQTGEHQPLKDLSQYNHQVDDLLDPEQDERHSWHLTLFPGLVDGRSQDHRGNDSTAYHQAQNNLKVDGNSYPVPWLTSSASNVANLEVHKTQQNSAEWVYGCCNPSKIPDIKSFFFFCDKVDRLLVRNIPITSDILIHLF